MVGYPVGRADHHGNHRTGEGHPLGTFLSRGPFVIQSRPTFSNSLREAAQAIKQRRSEKEFQRPTYIDWRGFD